MSLLTPDENRFLEVFLHEATTTPFTGPTTRALHKLDLEYSDISYMAWAYEQEVPRTSFAIGHTTDTMPPPPWPDRAAALRRNEEIQRIWEQRRRKVEKPVKEVEAK
jgi:hypothetical protein